MKRPPDLAEAFEYVGNAELCYRSVNLSDVRQASVIEGPPRNCGAMPVSHIFEIIVPPFAESAAFCSQKCITRVRALSMPRHHGKSHSSPAIVWSPHPDRPKRSSAPAPIAKTINTIPPSTAARSTEGFARAKRAAPTSAHPAAQQNETSVRSRNRKSALLAGQYPDVKTSATAAVKWSCAFKRVASRYTRKKQRSNRPCLPKRESKEVATRENSRPAPRHFAERCQRPAVRSRT